MITTEERLNEILATDDYRDRLTRATSFGPAMKTTAEIDNFSDFKTAEDLKIFKPSKAVAIFGLCAAIVIWVAMVFGIIKQKDMSATALTAAIIIALIITVAVIRRLFYKNKPGLNIYIDFEGIQADDELYKWEEIEETAVISYPGNGGSVNFLIILLRDGNFRKIKLVNYFAMDGIAKSISKYIEYYKKGTKIIS